jgi:MFS family permease
MSGFIGVNSQFAQKFRQPDAKLQGIITSIYDIEYAAGALLNFLFGEQFGCKNMIIAGGTTMIVGTVLGSSTTLAQLFGRIVTSIGNGFNSLTIPMYQYEICKLSNRGILLNSQGTVTIIGLCIAYLLDFRSFLCKSTHPRAPPLFFQAFLAVCLVLQMLPPTPRDTTLPD